jgi:DNA-binding response OmpR family regulator
VVAFDVDPESLAHLRQAFPAWEIEVRCGATRGALDRDWSPRAADVLVVGIDDPVLEALGLCRGLRSEVGRAHTPLLALVPPAREALVRAALEAGASRCLVLPVHPKELVSVVAHARAGHRQGRHTVNLDPAQTADPWQDLGGEA